jgi:hypothetical protein
MLRDDLKMEKRFAQRVMALARNPRFASNLTLLPRALSALGELARLSDDDFEAGKASGAINPSTTAKEASRLVKVRVTKSTTTTTPVRVHIFEAPTSAHAVSYRGGTISMPTYDEDVLREEQERRHVNEIIDAISSVSEADIEPLAKHLTQDRIADIEKVKQGIEVLRRLIDRLGGAEIVPFPKADD